MELAGDSKESRPRRFPDPLPPPHGHINQAAQRREELLWELHKERIRQDILLRELAETERAMAARFGTAGHWPMQAPPPSQDYWHQRRPPSLPPWDEAAPRPPRAGTDHPPCPYGSPAAARPPPMYPHVERSPSPVPQPRPAADGEQEQQQEGVSSGATERPILKGDVEGRPSPSKGTPPEGALVPDAANACAVTMLSSTSFAAEEVTPGERVGVGGEPKHDVENGHGVLPLHESGEQSSEQRKTAESTMKDPKDELVARLGQDSPTGQENRTSDEQKQTGFREPTPQAEETSAGVKMLTAATSPIGGVPKHDVEDGHGVQPLFGSGEQNNEQSAAESTVKDWRDELVAQLCQYSPAGQENGTSGEQKQTGFREPTPQAEETFSGVKRKLTAPTSPVAKKQKPASKWNCDLCQRRMTSMGDLVKHWAGKKHQSKMQARNKTAEAATHGSPAMCRNGDKSVAENGRCSVDAPRPAEGDREPASSRWTCNICDSKCSSASNLQDHLGGRRHRENTEAILAKFKCCYSRKDTEPGKNTYCCNVCDAPCNSDTMLASHLVGRRHRETLLGR